MFHRPKNEENETGAPRQGSTIGITIPASAAAPAPAAATAPRMNVPEIPKSDTPINISATPSQKTEDKIMSNEEIKQTARPLDIPSSAVPGSTSYQPQPARVPGYGSPSFPGAALAAVPAAKTQGRKLVIGEGISLSGEIEACEHLVIEGTVEAALKGASIVEIAQTGVFNGTIEIDEATVAGRFEGELTVNGRLTITSTGSVTGVIAYKELALEAGATLDGKVNPLSGSKVNAKKSDKPRENKAKAASPRNDNAGEGTDLLFTAAASAAV